MTDLKEAVVEAERALRKLRGRILAERAGAGHEETMAAIECAQDAFRKRFDRPRAAGRKRLPAKRLSTLARSVKHQKRMRKVAETALRKERADKMGNRIQSIWYVRAAMADPTVPARTLESFFRDFPAQETKNISTFSISRVRDAIAEIIKKLNRRRIELAMASMPAGWHARETHPVFIRHIHDEACMRMNSFMKDEDERYNLHAPVVRARSSKVQNDVVSVHFQDSALEHFVELKPLARKSAKTNATSLICVLSDVVSALWPGVRNPHGGRLRLIHVVMGDGISTNASAVRRVWRFMKESGLPMRYSLVVWRCASHVANLVVMTAICGRVVSRPVGRDRLCDTCSKFYKYLLADYQEEFAFHLRRYVVDNFRLVPFPEHHDALRGRAQARLLQQLYGKRALPDKLLDFFNGRLGSLEHVGPHTSDMKALQSEAYALIQKYCFKVEDNPVVTRFFFLFADAEFGFLRFSMLNVPVGVLSTGCVVPRQDSQERLKFLRELLADPDCQKHLHKVALCLRVALYATCLTAQSADLEGRPPLVARLGDGEVQAKTTQDLAEMLPLLGSDPELDVADAVKALLTTQTHIHIRFSSFNGYPSRLWKLCRKYNPVSYSSAIEDAVSHPVVKSWLAAQRAIEASTKSATSRARPLGDAVCDEIVSAKTHVAVAAGVALPEMGAPAEDEITALQAVGKVIVAQMKRSPEPQSACGLVAAAPPAFQKDDIIVLSVKKYKETYNGKKAKVLLTNTRQVKVELVDGKEVKWFSKECCKAIVPAGGAPEAAGKRPQPDGQAEGAKAKAPKLAGDSASADSQTLVRDMFGMLNQS
ncbi:unnamed protein product [Prorocentrum cordatum]|uniref:Uncharacterized protein n=1 Tax=Prorocentrum cordatum TaxID=2364126 RepID=A0ABN9XJI5_9DINO|nr:unnamed protein product [Polarella glacialis]